MEPITSNTNPAASLLPTSTTSTKTDADKQKGQFLQLLVAQLKGQNPLNPMEGSEFVAQLAQFTSVEELIKIRTYMGSVQDLLAKSQTPAQTGNANSTTETTAS